MTDRILAIAFLIGIACSAPTSWDDRRERDQTIHHAQKQIQICDVAYQKCSDMDVDEVCSACRAECISTGMWPRNVRIYSWFHSCVNGHDLS